MLRSAKDKGVNSRTIIGADVKMIGSLKDSGSIIINGHAQGEIFSDDCVFVGEQAHIEGPIFAKDVIICGKVDGEIKASERLEIAPTGKINGRIEAKILSVSPGAFFIGQCKMTESDALEELASEAK
ncbi:MAG: polymer-forming cytoskeletal protein [bacterium]|nr:polymer-forming cytoskeletal protein [bacterium]